MALQKFFKKKIRFMRINTAQVMNPNNTVYSISHTNATLDIEPNQIYI